MYVFRIGEWMNLTFLIPELLKIMRCWSTVIKGRLKNLTMPWSQVRCRAFVSEKWSSRKTLRRHKADGSWWGGKRPSPGQARLPRAVTCLLGDSPVLPSFHKTPGKPASALNSRAGAEKLWFLISRFLSASFSLCPLATRIQFAEWGMGAGGEGQGPSLQS